MSTILINIIAFIVSISILVTFHEWGHYLMARFLGVKVLRFSVGFGKRLIRYQRKDTEFTIALLPIGGYVKMLDEREAPVPEKDLPYAFNRQPLWARFLIVLAGPLANFIFAILAYWIIFMVGLTSTVPIIGEIVPQSIAQQAGMEAGEEIIQVDNVHTRTWSHIYKQLMTRIGEEGTVTITTEKDKHLKTYALPLAHWTLKGARPDLLNSLGIVGFMPPMLPIVKDVKEFEPASNAGLLPQDEIVAVDDKPIKYWKEFTEIVNHSIDKPLSVTVLREGKTITLKMTPRARESSTGEILGFLGIYVKIPEPSKEYLRIERLNPIEAFVEAVNKTGEFIGLTFMVLGKMLTGELGLKTISGPVAIAQGAGETASVGPTYYLGFLALISISLGVLNLLPIPILDGGHLLYYIIEAITGKPVPDRIQVIGFQIGLLLLVLLMMVAFYNDILRLF